VNETVSFMCQAADSGVPSRPPLNGTSLRITAQIRLNKEIICIPAGPGRAGWFADHPYLCAAVSRNVDLSHVDRAKAFYVDQAGFNPDHDYQVSETAWVTL
jgi:hypothetical protein